MGYHRWYKNKYRNKILTIPFWATMKIRLHFKTPDVVDYALDDQFPDKNSEQRTEAEEIISKFVKYGECLSVEVDTKTGTAKVLNV